jgi:chemotaxis protein methyltransferase CheR
MSSKPLSIQELTLVRKYMAEAIGISIGENKAYLVESRLAPIVADCGARDLLDLVARARADGSRRLHDRIVDALTTHETFWFRDERAWQALRLHVLPALADAARAAARPRLRLWCAACSTGQEPYTLAMLLDTLQGEGRLAGYTPAQIELLATDVAPETLRTAASGQYAAHEIQRGLGESWRNKYFP